MPLSPEEVERYSRQTILPEFGEEGQERLKSARVLIIGAGGLGSPAALYLAAMGVGTIGIVEFDRVSLSNLHRQILYTTSDIGKAKGQTASSRLSEINPNVTIKTFSAYLDPDSALDIISDFDLVIDGSDNFSTRYVINDACLVLGIPLISASILRFEGQLCVFGVEGGPCYRCVFPEQPSSGEVPSCAEAGVIGVLPGVMGTLAAMEAVKFLAKIGESLIGRLLLYNALGASFRTVAVERDPSCPICSKPQSERKLAHYDRETCDAPLEISWEEYERSPIPMVDVREELEFASRPSEGKLIPLGSFLDRIRELPQGPFAVVCSMGIRSLNAVKLLRDRGRADVRSIRGGMNARN
jgi:molybdopterin/thiamine biosynthesis adenylyltransferase/rhodanese-related sulfurtransferase